MDLNQAEWDKILRNKSSQHHYIPKFLIKGFTNEEGFLYIYDKQKNIVQKKPRHSSSIFWEKDRNSIEINPSQKSSFLEEEFYSKIDNDVSKVIKHFQNEDLNKIHFELEDVARFSFFIISLFWRIPYSDYASDNILERTQIISDSIDTEELRNDLTFRKIQRVLIVSDVINEIMKNVKKGSSFENIHQMTNSFIIGDNPILFKKSPREFKEFGEMEYLIALSSNRIYSSTNEKLEKLYGVNAFFYNISVIDQSKRYVASSNFKILLNLVNSYNSLKAKGALLGINEYAFNVESLEL